jgi:hypothetical protein
MRTTLRLFALWLLPPLFSCSSTKPPAAPAVAIAPVSAPSAPAVQVMNVEMQHFDLEMQQLRDFDIGLPGVVVEGLKRTRQLTAEQILERRVEDTSLHKLVKDAVDKAQGLTVDRQFVADVAGSLQPRLETEIGKRVGEFPVDPSPLAQPMYKNLAAMIKNLDDVSTFRGDHLAAIPRVEAVSLMPRGEQCTGVIIARNAIATASHCAIDGPTFIHIGDSAKGKGTNVLLQPSNFKYVVKDGRDLDMAIIVQKRRIPGIREEDLPAFATDAMIAAATQLSVVGFGGYYTDSSEAGVKRLGKIPMLSPDCKRPGEAEKYKCLPGFDIIAGARPIFDRTSCPRPTDAVIQNGACSGDSGGPVYVEANGKLFLAGLVSRTVDPIDCGCADATNLYVRFDTQIQFLHDLGVDFPPQALAALQGSGPTAGGGQ